MGNITSGWYWRWSLTLALAACRIPTVVPVHAPDATHLQQGWQQHAPQAADALRYELSVGDLPIAAVAIETSADSANSNVIVRATMQLAGAARSLFNATINETSWLFETGRLQRSTLDVSGDVTSHCYAATTPAKLHVTTVRQDFDDSDERKQSVWLDSPPLTISAWLLALQHWPIDRTSTTESVLILPDCQFATFVTTQRERAMIATSYGNRRAVRLEVQASLTGFVAEIPHDPIAISIWLSDDGDQWPLLLTAATPLGQARAVLVP